MSTRFTGVVPMVDQRAPRRIVRVHDARSIATAQALDWPGVMVEAGGNDIAEVDDLTLAHHYLGLNAGNRPVTLEFRNERGFRAVTIPPRGGWFTPAGEGFSLRIRCAGPHPYVRVAIDPVRFDRLIRTNEDDARPMTLRRTYDIGGPQVDHLASAMAAEAGAGTPSGLVFVDTLTAALAMQLIKQAGTSLPRTAPARGGLAPVVRRRVLELMEEQASTHLTIDTLAREAGLSPAHFARAFKESIGRAPHQHLLALRLDRARRLLEQPGVALSDIALRTGFADQAHFTRFFKRRFGVTPGVVMRSRQSVTG